MGKQGKMEHMTEIQDKKKGGPILYDLDFRYKPGTKERLFTDEHILDTATAIADKLKDVIKVEGLEPIPVFVFTKDNVNDIGKCVKDGIHMILGLRAKHSTQMYLRELLLKEIGCVFHDLKDDLCDDNTPDNIIDEGVCSGDVGWQMYGSCKPGHEAYKLRTCYEIKYELVQDSDYDSDEEEEESYDYE